MPSVCRLYAGNYAVPFFVIGKITAYLTDKLI